MPAETAKRCSIRCRSETIGKNEMFKCLDRCWLFFFKICRCSPHSVMHQKGWCTRGVWHLSTHQQPPLGNQRPLGRVTPSSWGENYSSPQREHSRVKDTFTMFTHAPFSSELSIWGGSSPLLSGRRMHVWREYTLRRGLPFFSAGGFQDIACVCYTSKPAALPEKGQVDLEV